MRNLEPKSLDPGLEHSGMTNKQVFITPPLEGRSRLKNEGLRETRKKRDLQNYSPLEGRAFRGESPTAR